MDRRIELHPAPSVPAPVCLAEVVAPGTPPQLAPPTTPQPAGAQHKMSPRSAKLDLKTYNSYSIQQRVVQNTRTKIRTNRPHNLPPAPPSPYFQTADSFGLSGPEPRPASRSWFAFCADCCSAALNSPSDSFAALLRSAAEASCEML